MLYVITGVLGFLIGWSLNSYLSERVISRRMLELKNDPQAKAMIRRIWGSRFH